MKYCQRCLFAATRDSGIFIGRENGECSFCRRVGVKVYPFGGTAGPGLPKPLPHRWVFFHQEELA